MSSLDRVKFTTLNAGSGSFIISAQVPGFLTPQQSGMASGQTLSYIAFSSDQLQWEYGHSTYTAIGNFIARSPINSSAGLGLTVNFTLAPTVAITLLSEDLPTVAGTSGQIQYNNSGVFGAFTVSGDGTINTSTGILTITGTGGIPFGPLSTLGIGTGLSSSGGNLNISNQIAAGGPIGSSSVIPIITWNAQGQLTSVSSAPLSASSFINGTTNFLSRFTGPNAVGNSNLFQSGTFLGINTITPANTLDIGDGGGIHITSGVPGSTSFALYNNAGTLTWNGIPLATGSSVSGTTNFISVFTAASSIGNSVIYQSTTNIGFNTTTPLSGLDVSSIAVGSYSGSTAAPANGLIVSGNVGVGTGSPDSPLTISANTVAVPGALLGGTVFHLIGKDTTSSIVSLDAFGAPSVFVGRRANGTAASPSAVTIGQNLLTIAGLGWQSSGAWSATGRANINFAAAESWTSTSQGAYFSFLTTPIGTTTPAEAVRINPSGGVGVGTTTDPGAGNLSVFNRIGVNTTSPSQALDIFGAIALSGHLFAQNSNYNIIYDGAANTTLFLGYLADPTNYYRQTTHIFQSIGGGVTFGDYNSLHPNAWTLRGNIIIPTGSMYVSDNQFGGIANPTPVFNATDLIGTSYFQSNSAGNAITHLNLYGSSYGFGVSSGRLNIASGGAFAFWNTTTMSGSPVFDYGATTGSTFTINGNEVIQQSNSGGLTTLQINNSGNFSTLGTTAGMQLTCSQVPNATANIQVVGGPLPIAIFESGSAISNGFAVKTDSGPISLNGANGLLFQFNGTLPYVADYGFTIPNAWTHQSSLYVPVTTMQTTFGGQLIFGGFGTTPSQNTAGSGDTFFAVGFGSSDSTQRFVPYSTSGILLGNAEQATLYVGNTSAGTGDPTPQGSTQPVVFSSFKANSSSGASTYGQTGGMLLYVSGGWNGSSATFTQSVTLVAAQKTYTLSAAPTNHHYVPGMPVVSSGSPGALPSSTVIVTVSGNTITLNNAPSSPGACTLTFWAGKPVTSPPTTIPPVPNGAYNPFAGTPGDVFAINGETLIYDNGIGIGEFLEYVVIQASPGGSVNFEQRLTAGITTAGNLALFANSGGGFTTTHMIGWQVDFAVQGGFGFYASSSGGATFDFAATGTGHIMDSSFIVTNPSEPSIKRDIEKLPSVIAAIIAIDPVTFWYRDSWREQDHRIGFLARNFDDFGGVRETLPSVLSSIVVSEEKVGCLGLKQADMLPILWKGVQELSEEIDKLKIELHKLKSTIH